MVNIWEAMARAQEEDGVSGYDLIKNEDSETNSSDDSEEELD